MLRTIQLARTADHISDFPIFPDPESVFHEWNDELAQRFLPVGTFDLSLAQEGSIGRAVFLYYEDPSIDFLSWEMENGKIKRIDQDWMKVRPFIASPDIEKIWQRIGAFLHYIPYEIEIGAPSDYEASWCEILVEKFEEIDVSDALSRLRIGGGYPCYVQGTIPLDDPGFVAELPTSAFELEPMYLYLSEYKQTYQQEMEMT